MIGSYPDTPRRRVERQIRLWRGRNPRPTAFDRQTGLSLLLWSSRHPKVFIFSTALLCAVLALVPGWLLPEVFKIPVLARDWMCEPSDLLGIYNAIFAIQATVTAVVYPIVIAFVALLLQQVDQSMATLRTYLIDSGVLPAGLSAIALLVVLGLIELFMLISGTGSLHVFLYGAILWFSLNMLLATWFLYRTLLYIDPTHRSGIFTQHALNLVYPCELRTLMAQHELDELLLHFRGEEAQGEPDRDFSADSPTLEISIGHEGTPIVSATLSGYHQLWDVRLDRLKSALERWRDRIGSASKSEGQSLRCLEVPTISFPAVLGERVHGQIVVCRGENVEKEPHNADVKTKNEIWRAFQFRRVGRAWIPDSSREVLETLVRDVISQMDGTDQDNINEAYTRVMNLHTELLECGWITNDDGKVNNIAFRWPSLHLGWARVYAPALEAAVDRLPDNAVAFRVSCWLTRDLVGQVEPRPVEIPLRLLEIHVSLLEYLSNWWSRRIVLQESGSDQNDAANGMRLLPPMRETYRRALMAFIGPWEQAELGVGEHASDTKDPEVTWKIERIKAQFRARKLELTCKMIIGAVRRGDTEAAYLLCDSFLQLYPQEKWEAGSWEFRQDRQPFFTIVDCDKPWKEASSSLNDGQLSMGEDDLLSAARSLPIAALRNFWEDVRNLLMLVLLRLTESPEPGALAFRSAYQLIAGKQEFAGLNNSPPIMWPKDTILPFIRQSFSSNEYRERFNLLLEEQFDRFNLAELISGRGGVTVGRFDLEALLLQRIQSFCLVAPDGAFSAESYEKLFDRARGQLRQLPTVVGNLSSWAKGLEPQSVQRSQELVSALKGELGRAPCSRGSARWTHDFLHWVESSIQE